MPKTRRTAEANPVTFALWSDQIQPVINWLDGERGRRTEFLEAYRLKIAPEKVTRQVAESWLATDPQTRTEPMAGNAFAILATAEGLGIIKPKRK